MGGQNLPEDIWKYCGYNFGNHEWGRPAFSGQEPGTLNNMPGSEQFPPSKGFSSLSTKASLTESGQLCLEMDGTS